MARQKVVKVRCDRCKRVEYQEEDSPQISFELTLDNSLENSPIRHVHFDDLCGRCSQILINYADKMDIVARNSGAKEEDESKAEEPEEVLPPSGSISITVD